MSVPEWVTLSEDERIVWTGSPSFFVALWSLLTGFLVVLAGVALYVVLVAVQFEPRRFVLWLVPLGIALIALSYLRHRSTRYVITTNEVYRKDGFLSRSVTSLRLDRVQNTSFSQSFLDRLFSLGDVNIDTAGSGATEIVFASVSNPQKVSGLLTEQLDRTAPR